MRTKHALALVESPAQLMNVVELGQQDRASAGARILVLAPADGFGRTQLRAMADLARRAGHEVCWQEPRSGGAAVARSVRAVAAELAGVDHLVIGDPFSGMIQVIASLTRPAVVTVVDDGTATLEFARQWAAGEQLTRWHDLSRPAGRARTSLAAGLRRRLSPATGCALRLFTALPVQLPGIEVVRNDFTWVRRTPPPQVTGTTDLVGTSLVESGVLHEADYLGAVSALARQHGAARSGEVRYWAHRREGDAKLAAVRSLGLTVLRPDLPLELVARRGPVGARVVSFPSTVVHTLPLVLAGSGAEVVAVDLADTWFTAPVTAGAEAFLRQVNATARLRHGLAGASC